MFAGAMSVFGKESVSHKCTSVSSYNIGTDFELTV